ncbi:MFS transporter [Shewanella sedimentimangrovi]|uniref:MFS transporter n=1 Tax=Shewanella sedimentimangrovi TaxID=2814293 RepID=A0ABX7QZ96_9GAMM|nr:MFS transporter [Shewanella sedimentimangrovi]QSX35945.1 MFS transporter [Shewanella sedimentimangrovi]
MTRTMSTEAQLRWLSACYFFFFAILGVMVPYLGVFFDARGFNASEIGLLLAILMATRILAPNLWAMVADRTGMRAELIKLGAGAGALTYVSFFYPGSFGYMALSLAVYTFFWNAILAQLEVITLETLGDRAHRYGIIRSYGSLGYICLVVGAGFAIGQWGPEILPYIGMTLFIGMLASCLPLPANRVKVEAKAAGGFSLRGPIAWFLLSAILLQMSAGPFYGFFVLYLKQAGYSEFAAGLAVALGVVAEILMFMLAPRLLGRYGSKPLMFISILLTSARWLMMAFGVDSLFWLSLAQSLHAFTFGLVHAASIQFIHQQFDSRRRSQGQALYASLSFGVGGAIGTWLCGHIWGIDPSLCWVFAAVCALLAALAVLPLPGRAKPN